MVGKIVGLEGKRFGRWVVLSKSETRNRGARWLCKCDCGVERVVRAGELRSGISKSCGCLRADRMTTHGLSGTKEHIIWKGMHARCYNSNNPRYINYGGRCLTVCERWKGSFTNFLEDMGPIPGEGYSIERIDINEGYSKDNCIWLPLGDQSRNRGKLSNNTSGHTGVGWNIRTQAWKAEWRNPEGKVRSKYFSVKRYGGEAFKLACEYRDEMIEELRTSGVYYGEDHGK